MKSVHLLLHGLKWNACRLCDWEFAFYFVSIYEINVYHTQPEFFIWSVNKQINLSPPKKKLVQKFLVAWSGIDFLIFNIPNFLNFLAKIEGEGESLDDCHCFGAISYSVHILPEWNMRLITTCRNIAHAQLAECIVLANALVYICHSEHIYCTVCTYFNCHK